MGGDDTNDLVSAKGDQPLHSIAIETGASDASVERHQGRMWLGAIMATVCVLCGVIAAMSIRTPALISITLLCLGAACAGAALAVVTDGDAYTDNSQKVPATLAEGTQTANRGGDK